MKTDTRRKILNLIIKKQQLRPHDLVDQLGISNVAIHKHLKKLIDEGDIQKIGQPPYVFYVPKNKIAQSVKTDELDKKTQNFLNSHYLYLTPNGTLLKGVTGFKQWLLASKQETRLKQLAQRYIEIRTQANSLYKHRPWINASYKIDSSFKRNFLDGLFYQDFYSLPEFGKTQLGNLVLHAKTSQNKQLITQIGAKINNNLQQIINEYHIDAIAFIPHSIPRKIPFLNFLQANLALELPHLKLIKAYTGQIIVAQKSLSKLEERIINAKETIFIKDSHIHYQNILLIDDAVGSGATLNETAKKFKQNYGVKKVYGFAIVGSLKGFEVITEI